MKLLPKTLALTLFVALSTLISCAPAVTKSADVTGVVRNSLDQAGLKDVTVKQDQEKGVVTLGGHVATESEKSQAEMLTKPLAPMQVVAVEIAVVPVGAESEAKAINSDLDKAIEKNLDAALLQSKLHEFVKYDVKNSVVTLSGEVESAALRALSEKVAMGVPNVKQVVNTVQLKNQKATSTK